MLCHLLPRLIEAEGISVSQMRGGLKEVKMGTEKEEGYRVTNRGLLERKLVGMAWGLGLFLFGQNGGCLGTCSGMGRPELTLAPQQLPDHPSNSSVCLSLILGAKLTASSVLRVLLWGPRWAKKTWRKLIALLLQPGPTCHIPFFRSSKPPIFFFFLHKSLVQA